MQKNVKVGLIGCGPRGHGVMVNSYMKCKRMRLRAVCDKHAALVKRTFDAAGDPELGCYIDHQKMLREADIEAVVICVEPHNNAELVCAALEAGKHVMCDVPLAYTVDECWRIVLAVEKSGLKFQLGEQMRYSPHIRAWQRLVAEGRLGKILFAQGQYLHSRGDDRYWMDKETGARLGLDAARNNPRAAKSRCWDMPHPILYLPHELSPLLHVLDDRVTRVTCMGTRRQSYHHEWFPVPDFEVALMQTEKDTLMRMAAGFTAPCPTPYHWHNLVGTRGAVETNRSEAEKMKMWLADAFMRQPEELNWEFETLHTPPEALSSGHGGIDYYPMATFVESILEDRTPPLDVYKAADTAAPGIMAARSAEQGSACLEVPDFRPGAHRAKGARPSTK
ncbi:MAG: Gfo/Idh/MocA family oxidoreductase [Kiritimatiellae bacterium]|nr:Gfo/Idh/MocA family oxidoreductase [Kiritimatiellia bacterium]